VVDPDPEARGHVEATPGYGRLEEALAAVDCDAVLVASPPGTHHAVAKDALAAGKHVLCEKPLATNLEDAFDLVGVAERAQRILMVSQNYRYNAPFRAMQRLVMQGELGDLASIRISFRRGTRSLFAPEDFRYSMRHPYVLDMSRGWRVPDSPFVHQPAVAALLDLEGGVPVIYEGDWATHEPETSWNGDWEIIGEDGRLLWSGTLDDRGTGEVIFERWGRGSHPVEQHDLEFVEREATLQALRAAIEGGEPPETVGADNVKSLAAMLGCVKSIESGDPVDVSALLGAKSAKL
jgi:predicted dehydrogenase